MMGREKLHALKKAARRKTAGMELPIQTMHSLIDHGLEALDVIDGGNTMANRQAEMRTALAEVRTMMLAGDTQRAAYALDLATGMLSTDYRRYSTWADIRPQIEEEFDR